MKALVYYRDYWADESCFTLPQITEINPPPLHNDFLAQQTSHPFVSHSPLCPVKKKETELAGR